MKKFATTPAKPNRLLVFARMPERGRVKTRLASALGEDRALALYDAMLRDLLDAVGGSKDQLTVEIVWTGSTEIDGRLVHRLFGSRDLSTQCGRSLGERLLVAFHERIAFYGAEKVMAIGSDDPTLTREFIDNAFALLDSCDWVIGPAADGGYYLIGCRAGSFDLRIFEGIEWGSDRVLPSTVEKLKELHEIVALLPMRADLDVADDVRAFSRAGTAAARTRQVLREWGWVA